MLLYDLTSTYFESDPPFEETDKRQFGYSRDKRSDCVQVVIGLIVTPEGFPLAYRRGVKFEKFLRVTGRTSPRWRSLKYSAERKHGKLGRVWVFDRGIVSEENLNLLRSRGASYLVATPKRLLTRFQKELLAEDWTQVANHPQIQVKRIERDGELYVLTRSLARAEKERAMRQRGLKGLRKDLAENSVTRFVADGFAGRNSFTHGSDDSRNVGPRRGLTSKT